MKPIAAGTGVAAIGLVMATGMWSPVEAQEPDDEPRSAMIAQAFGGAYLGVEIDEVASADVAEMGLDGEYGVIVRRVVEEGPADDAGLEAGDVIRTWNGERVAGVAQLQRLVRETPVGRSVRLGLVRDGATRDVTVEIGQRSFQGGNLRISGNPMAFRLDESAPRRALSFSRPEGSNFRLFIGTGRMGAEIQSLGEQLAEYFGVDGGALVASVEEDSPAARAGLRAGDVIIEFDGEDIEDPIELHRAVADIEEGTVGLRVMRDGREQTLTIELPERFGALDLDGRGALEWAGVYGNWSVPRLQLNVAPRLRTRIRSVAPRLRGQLAPLLRTGGSGRVSI